MAPHRRHRIGASRRRRREDEGEDEGSIDGALEDDSLSEGSVLSHQDDDDADGEGSDASAREPARCVDLMWNMPPTPGMCPTSGAEKRPCARSLNAVRIASR